MSTAEAAGRPRLVATLRALVAHPGVDAVAFTGGIGENSARLRSACCEGLDFLGIALDPEKNETGTGDRVVSGGRVAVLALATNEELIVARRSYRVLAGLTRSGQPPAASAPG